MGLSHVGVWTANIEKLRTFYEDYFGGQSGRRYHNPKRGFTSYFLRFEGGGSLELMTLETLADQPFSAAAQSEVPVVGLAHIAFTQQTAEDVDVLTARLRRDGYPVVSGPRITGDGYYESGVLDPEGNLVEIVGPTEA